MTQPAEPMSWFTKNELRTSFLRIEEIRKSGILSDAGLTNPLFKSAVIELLIYINDLMQKADAHGQRITVTDHLPDNVALRDVTELIAKCRDAACHVSAGLEFFERNKFSFALAVGKVPDAVVIDGKAMGCDFDDDVAIFFGAYRLYLRRNLLDGYTLAVRALQSMFDLQTPPRSGPAAP